MQKPLSRAAQSAKVRSLALTGMLFAAALVLTMVEWMIPPVPGLPPGVRLGLSNIVVMYALFFMGKRTALTIAVLKAGFTFLTRGVMAAMLSLCGGLLSLLLMILLTIAFKDKISYLILSISGAVAHNLGQLAAVCLLYQMQLWLYLPLLLAAGVAAGAVTAGLLRVVLPALGRLELGSRPPQS